MGLLSNFLRAAHSKTETCRSKRKRRACRGNRLLAAQEGLAIWRSGRSPTFSLITVMPCFFVRDPPALMRARVVFTCQPNFLQIPIGLTG
jgi:hypothetical protein